MPDYSTKDIVDHLMDIKEKQAEHGAKQDAIYEDVGELKNHVGVQNGRIGSLERWRWLLTGGIILAVFAVKFLWG